MRRLLTALGVDYEQWRALTATSLKLDLRAGSFGGARTGRSGSGGKAILGQVIFYAMLGIAMTLMVATVPDRFVVATILYSYVILMVGTAMLVDHSTAITSPADYGILGYQPISSRTYFVSKLANVLAYTLAMTTAIGILPTVALCIRYGLLVGAAGTAALYACALAVMLVVVTGYAWLMQRVGARRLRRALSYIQMLAGLLVYGGFFLTSEGITGDFFAGFSVERTPWLLLYPATWFGSWMEVAAGSTSLLDLAPVLASVLLLGWLATRLRGRLSLHYAERLSALAADSSAAPPRPRPTSSKRGRWFRRGEARAVAILVGSHFRDDLKFRMGVLAVIPLTLIYLVMGLREAASEGSGGDFSLVAIAVLLFPVILKQHLAHSDAFHASWIFFATPADRTRAIRSAKNVLVIYFLAPYLAFVGLALALLTRDATRALVYVLLLGALSHLVLLLLTLVNPELPFAKPVEKGRGTSRILGAMIAVALVGSAVPFLAAAVESSPTTGAVTFGSILVATLALNRLLRARIERQASRLEFQG